MYILEWSDTQLKFRITEYSSSSSEALINYADYDKIVAEIKLLWKIIELEWTVDWEYVIFDIFSEFTKDNAWSILMDIRWIKWEKKIRFNENTVSWVILKSIRIPEWE